MNLKQMLLKVRFNKIKMETITLVRLGIGNYASALPKEVDWAKVRDIAEQQGLYAIVLDGIEKLPQSYRPPQEILLEWIGEVLQGYEYIYEQYGKTISELAGFYNCHGYKMMVLKGYACSLDWPKPNHRPCGDIDIWQFGAYKEADKAIASEKGVKVDKSHHHHTVFEWRDFTVENHYDFINVHHHRSNVEIDKEFKKLAMDDSYSVKVGGEKVYLPLPNLHALFLMRHAMNHFSTSEISLRNLLDWAFFVEKHGKEVDWEWLVQRMEYYGMMPLFQIFNAICVEELGFKVSLFPTVQFLPDLKEKVLKEIISPSFGSVEPKNIFRRVVFKYKRWRGNGWKHELCFNESLWSAFWSGVWSHILKPASI